MFSSPSQSGSNPEMCDGTPAETDFLAVGPATRDLLFEQMERVVDAGITSQATASWLLHLAFEDAREADNLMNRLTRPSGFNGINAL